MDLSNYVTKSNIKKRNDQILLKKGDLPRVKSDIYILKNVPIDLSSLKRKVDKLHIGKLETASVDLSKLSDVVKNDIFKKTEYDELVKNVNNNKTTNTNNLIKKTDYDTKIYQIGKKITDRDHGKYITTKEFNKLSAANFAARLKQANLAYKNDIANFLKKTYFDEKLINISEKFTSHKTQNILIQNESKAEQDKIKKNRNILKFHKIS